MVDDVSRPNAYTGFNYNLNRQSKSNWKVSGLSTSVDFLEITIMINTHKLPQTFKHLPFQVHYHPHNIFDRNLTIYMRLLGKFKHTLMRVLSGY